MIAASAPTPEVKPRPLTSHWFSRAAFSVVSILHYLTQLALAWALYRENYWLAVPLILICSHFMHGLLIGFHEASHGCLKRHRLANEIEGLVIGTFSLMSFTLYRVSHQTHHAHLGTERDEELWPFVKTGVPRWGRITAAFFELTLGLFFTPFLFLRTFLRKDSPVRSRRIRNRIWKELAVIVVFWTLALAAVVQFDLWRYFFGMYLIPALIAGNLQSWRKYIEHVGLTGSTVRSGTRSIVARDPIGRVISFTLLHEPYHGVHHLHVGLPHAELPGSVASLEPATHEEFAPFPSYRHAFAHLFRSLSDPRVGSQWQRHAQPAVSGPSDAPAREPR